MNETLTDQKIFDSYPEELTIDEFENIDWNFCKTVKDENFDNKNGLSSTQNACKFAMDFIKKHKGRLVLYTLLDGEQDVIYLKGNHLVNRIGVWQITKNKEFEK